MARRLAIIFGVHGQDGHYLRQILTREGIETVGVARSTGDWIHGSVCDRRLVENLIKDHQPEFVFHLAANSTTRHSALFENHETISTGSLNILEAVYQYSPSSKVFLAGSGLQFENQGRPIDESAPWAASSAYSVARIQLVYAARYYRRMGIKTYVGYLFNHDSPLREEHHVSQKIARAAKRIAGGSSERLEIGSLQVRKEYAFAGDIAEAIWCLVNNSAGVAECVMGCCEAYSIEQWTERCFAFHGLDWQKSVKSKAGFQPEYEVLVSKPDLLRSLGWAPKVNFEQLAVMMSQ